MPFSNDFEWFWSDDDDHNQVLSVEYKWDQKHNPYGSVIKVSCLGHYQLNVNNKYYYYGPVFANYPKVYYDELDISKYINIGQNKISISCQYLNVKTHEHQIYPSAGLLIGGYIHDGILRYKLSDHRLWHVDKSLDIKFGERLSMDSGFSEITKYQYQDINKKIIKKDHKVDLVERPIDLLSEKKYTPVNIGGDTYDLGRYMNGYLEIRSNTNEDCELKVSYFSGYSKGITVDDHNGQDDVIYLPSGNFILRQFSRRSGRYIKLENNTCGKNLEISFFHPEYTIPLYSLPDIVESSTKDIFEISQNSINNGLLDQIEDSLVRERALYVGDAYSVFKCIPPSGSKNKYFKYIIQSFIDSQKDDGSIPSMAHSQSDFIIPNYALILPILLEEYVSQSGDINLFIKNEDSLKLLFKWIKNNQSDEGFFYDKENKGYWNFTDWTKTEWTQKFNTSNQLYLIKAYDSYISLLSKVARNTSEFKQDREKIYGNLITLSYNPNLGIFSDSFSASKSSGGIITNSLAGKFELFPSKEESKKAFIKFSNQNTESPYSQTWLAEWGILLDENNLVKNIISRYWGEMVKLGSTSVYETFKPGAKNITTSHSHIWGCGPSFLIPKIYQK